MSGLDFADPLTGATTSVVSLGTVARYSDFEPATNLYYGISERSGSIAPIVADLSALTSTSLDALDNDMHVISFITSKDDDDGDEDDD